VAGLTTAHWNVRIVDEYADPVDFAEECDLVGITAYSCNANRAYELAKVFRQKGIPVVMGGIHVSMVPDEAALRADAVVVGEAESVWADVISDFEAGHMRKRYEGGRHSLAGLPVPRRDLFSGKYGMDVIQTTRGCPFGCEFCSVTAFNGREYRQRPVGEVLSELETVKKKVVYFVDDNFFGVTPAHEERALELCSGMVKRRLHKLWVTQASINIAENREVLDMAARSGCRGLYIGIEAVTAETLEEMKKRVNLRVGVDGIRDAVRRIHRHGICVIGAFIFGSDHDDLSVFHKSLDFIRCARVDVPQLGMLTPFPGTKVFERLSREGRVVDNNYPADWDRYDTDHLVFKPKRIDPVDLVRGFDYVARAKFSRSAVWLQTLKTLIDTRSPAAALLTHNMNSDSRRFYDFDSRFSSVSGCSRSVDDGNHRSSEH
jgi:radical SAM superfamily enzyme YgiQ (UPF0313 family)